MANTLYSNTFILGPFRSASLKSGIEMIEIMVTIPFYEVIHMFNMQRDYKHYIVIIV